LKAAVEAIKPYDVFRCELTISGSYTKPGFAHKVPSAQKVGILHKKSLRGIPHLCVHYQGVLCNTCHLCYTYRAMRGRGDMAKKHGEREEAQTHIGRYDERIRHPEKMIWT
jgi:hypothetical protein